MIKIQFLLLYVIIVISGEKLHTETSKCEGVHIRGECYRKHVIMNGINRPYQLAIYNKDHKIYFSYNVGDDKEDKFGVAYVRITDTKPTNITSIKNGFAIAIDEHSHYAYFGGSEGIYSENLTKSNDIKHIVKDYDVWDMFYHHHLYFVSFPSQRLHKYEKGKNVTLQEHIHEQIYQFAIDGDNDTFITTKNGLHVIKNGTNDRISYSGPKIFRAIEVNHAGVAHFCGQNSIYVAHKDNHTLVKIAEIKNVFGLTFDSSDHLIYSNEHEIVKLLPGESKKKQ